MELKNIPIFFGDFYRKYIFSNFYKTKKHFGKNIKRSSLPLEVIIPCIDKDSITLETVVKSLREHLKHPIKKITIIIPRNSDIINKIALKNGIDVLYEDDIVPIKKSEINYITTEGKDRSGWLYQQLIKLYYSYHSKEKMYYVIDSDTILISDQVFEDNNKIIYLFSDEHHKPYYDIYYKLLKEKTGAPMSFVAHQMLFNKNIVQELINKIERIHNDDFISILLNNLDIKQNSGFSEFELYGNYVYSHYRNNILVEYWFNKGNIGGGEDKEIIKKFENLDEYRSISFHHYL